METNTGVLVLKEGQSEHGIVDLCSDPPMLTQSDRRDVRIFIEKLRSIHLVLNRKTLKNKKALVLPIPDFLQYKNGGKS